ncbi:MAG: hypothetical protein OXL41_14085 [Nitrospinae bacterium]|nr:hypothetical protein [Nitrospinota bacterium]
MTFREKSTNKLYAFALAAVFAIALAGCGGGGTATNGGGDTGTTMPDTSLADAQDAAQAAYDAAKAAVDAATANRDSDSASYDAALQALGAAEAANSAAQAATTTEAALAAQADAEAARDNAVKYAGMVNQAKADADEAAAAKAAQEAANKVAGTKETAIATEAAADAADLVRPFDGGAAITGDGTASATADTMYKLTVKHDGSMSTVAVLDERNLAKGDPKFSMAARFGDGQMLTRDNSGTSREIIVLHTDIEAATPTAFSKVYTLDTSDDPDTTVVDNRALTVDNTAHLAHVDLGISTPDEDATATKPFTQDNAATPAVNEGMHRGSFDGAMGTFLCGSADCSMTINDEGEGTALVGTWTFTPDAGATVDVADADYMYYGFWLDTTLKDGATSSYNTVQTFAGSSLPADARTLDSVTGTADYVGGAAGVYVHNTVNPDSSVAVKTSGRFTADVNLDVAFDATTTRVANSITGSISNFQLEHGESHNWNVAVSAGITSAFALENGVASGMRGNDGSLSGQFHTPAGRDAADAPEVLVGEFNATFVNGSAAGAFGARLDD